MEGCLYFILLMIVVFIGAIVISALLATVISLFTLIFHRRWDWRRHFESVFEVVSHIAVFILDVGGSSISSSSSSSGKSSDSSSDSSFGGGSSRGGGSGRSF
ncbi:MAG: hypothetical protein J6K32_06855 [Clostridia bacterium]|nr:hypothetical protein [Clostridia bacterium]